MVKSLDEFCADTYWSDRSELEYYAEVQRMVGARLPDGGTLLDVGGGVSFGAKYLEQLPLFERTSVELPSDRIARLDDVELIEQDFREWESRRRFDVVLCLQVLEHIENPEPFVRKLFRFSRNLVVISVPYLWPESRCEYHLHDPVSLGMVRTWCGREPSESVVVSERLVCSFLCR